jgi:hypothetical protein
VPVSVEIAPRRDTRFDRVGQTYGRGHVSEPSTILAIQPIRPAAKTDELIEIAVVVKIRPRVGLTAGDAEQIGLDELEVRSQGGQQGLRDRVEGGKRGRTCQRAPDVGSPLRWLKTLARLAFEAPSSVRRVADCFHRQRRLRALANRCPQRLANRSVGSSPREAGGASIVIIADADQLASPSRTTKAGLPTSGARSTGQCRPRKRFVKRRQLP